MRLTLLGRDVLVVFALFGLGGWREERLGELLGLDEAGGEGDAVDGAGLLVF